jgi:hypothetical protein
MSAYVRVELHERNARDKPSAEVYGRLHELLASKGIQRWVNVAEVGNQYLPTAFYYTKASDKNEIGKDVQWAADQTGYAYSYVVVISAGALVHNLGAYSKA